MMPRDRVWRRMVTTALLRCSLLLGLLGAVFGCALREARLTGAQGPVFWGGVTDMSLTHRALSGSTRDLYSFTLVLQERQGIGVTFTALALQVSHPVLHPTGVQRQTTIAWDLRPYGERRIPFVWPYACPDAACRRHGLTYHLVLSGSDARGQTVETALDFRLPPAPRTLTNCLNHRSYRVDKRGLYMI